MGFHFGKKLLSNLVKNKKNSNMKSTQIKFNKCIRVATLTFERTKTIQILSFEN